MRLREMKESEQRAGVYPVFLQQGKRTNITSMWVYLMIPSDPAYGGDKPQLPKGRVDEGENTEQAAIREAQEEVGLRADNIKEIQLITKETISGRYASYDIFVYGAEVIDSKAFDDFGWESKWAGWMPIDEALQKGRDNQRHFLQALKAKYL